MKATCIVPTEGKLPERPLAIQDPPDVLPEITQAEIVAFSTASVIFRMARAAFEAKRAARPGLAGLDLRGRAGCMG